ncbi:MAG: thiamine-phosphate kinase, partial [Pseudomonadota bacterium]
MGEFELIRRYFSDCGARRADIAVGVGDDCALLRPDSARLLAVSIDTLVAGVHFFPEVAPDALGHKALAVNLSDLAAMGAEPAWFTLALTLPASDPDWLAAFADGLCGLARRFGIRLVGGDTTRGPLAVTLQVHGWVAQDRVLPRQGARPEDWVCVTGNLGDAALALRLKRLGESVPEILQQRLDRPWPRVAEGLALGG